MEMKPLQRKNQFSCKLDSRGSSQPCQDFIINHTFTRIAQVEQKAISMFPRGIIRDTFIFWWLFSSVFSGPEDYLLQPPIKTRNVLISFRFMTGVRCYWWCDWWWCQRTGQQSHCVLSSQLLSQISVLDTPRGHNRLCSHSELLFTVKNLEEKVWC